MTTQSIRIIRSAIEDSMGDDLERANRAFGHMTTEQLAEQHGQSGETRGKVWQAYKDDRAKRVAALAEFDASHPS